MSYIKIDGKLHLEITGMQFTDEKLMLYSVARLPKRKHIPTKGRVPLAIYGDDETLIAVGKFSAWQLAEAHDKIRDGDLFLKLPIEFITGLESPP